MSAVAPSTRAERKREANATALLGKRASSLGMAERLWGLSGSILGPGSKVRAEHDAGGAHFGGVVTMETPQPCDAGAAHTACSGPLWNRSALPKLQHYLRVNSPREGIRWIADTAIFLVLWFF